MPKIQRMLHITKLTLHKPRLRQVTPRLHSNSLTVQHQQQNSRMALLQRQDRLASNHYTLMARHQHMARRRRHMADMQIQMGKHHPLPLPRARGVCALSMEPRGAVERVTGVILSMTLLLLVRRLQSPVCDIPPIECVS